MWNDVIDNLMLYQNSLVFIAFGMLIVSISSMILVRLIHWNSWTLKIYGVFVGISNIKLFALALLMVRILFLWSIPIYVRELKLTYIVFGVVITFIIHLILARPLAFILDAVYMVTLYGMLYVCLMIKTYLSSINLKASLVIMFIIILLFLVSLSLYATMECFIAVLKHKNKKQKSLITVILPRATFLLSGAFLIFVPYFFLSTMDTLVLTRNLYQNTANGTVLFQGESKIMKSGTGCVLVNKEEIYELMESPLYFEGENKILLPASTSIIQPELSLTNRIENMSLLYEEQGKYYVETKENKIRVDNFFLFDGKNTYMFFEPIILTWEENTLQLEPFSYITVKYNQKMEIFDRGTQTMNTILTGISNITTKMECGTTVNLSTDIIIRKNGQEQMLFINPNLLEDLIN